MFKGQMVISREYAAFWNVCGIAKKPLTRKLKGRRYPLVQRILTLARLKVAVATLTTIRRLRLKNITVLTGSLHDRTIAWFKAHPDPKTYQRLGDRSDLGTLGEGEKTRVVGYLRRAKLEYSRILL